MDWQLNQSISAGLTFSDNVNLDPDNQKEEGVTPTATYTIVGTGQSGRALVATDARISLRGATNQFDADINQRINVLGRVELLSDRLFIDGLVDSKQVLIDSNSRVSTNPNSGRNSSQSVTTLAISPVYQEKLGNWADTQLGYEHREVWAGGNVDDASFDAVNFIAASGSRFSRWKPTVATGWADYRETVARPTNSKDDVEALYIELDNQFQISKNYALLGLVGYNEVDAPTSSRDLSGFYWNVGVLATPNPRTQLTLRIGQRFDEIGVTGNLSYMISPNLVFRANAVHDVGTSLVRSASGFQRLSVTTLQGGLTGGNGLPIGFVNNGALDDGLSTQQSFGAGLVGTYGRSTFTVGSNFNNKTFDNGSDRTWVNRIGWSRQLNRLLTFDFSLAYRFVDSRVQADTQAVGGTVRLDYQLGANFSIFGILSHSDRFSDSPQLEYSENAATIGGRYTF